VIEQIRDFRRRLDEGAAERQVPTCFGTGLFQDSARDVYDANGVHVRENVLARAAELAADADTAMAAFHHRRVVVEGAQPELAQGFAALGWTMQEHVVMARTRPPDRSVDTSAVREVPFEALVPARRLATLREPWGYLALADALDRAKRRVMATVETRFFAAFAGDEIAAYCELRSDGRVAQIEDVNTLAEHRGRGLGRVVVQAAADAAAGHDVVFLEAFADDWPRELYAKLGFDIVGGRHLFTLLPHPLTRLVLRTPRLELRLGTRAELRALAEVARGGIHPPDVMPFQVAWTDRAAEPTFDDEFVAFHQANLADWRPDAWHYEPLVLLDGAPVGVQALRAEGFADTRTVDSGSWLGAPWQGRGLGTEMRSAILALAFDGLGAEAARSGALDGNAASLGVSRKLGYEHVGTSAVFPRGVAVPHTDLELRRDDWRPTVDVTIEGLDGVRELFGA
jgi:RimJ/RimL family protein N-acetyltransferase/ribosomal protein S18 acetylase RimI-like enzyme